MQTPPVDGSALVSRWQHVETALRLLADPIEVGASGRQRSGGIPVGLFGHQTPSLPLKEREPFQAPDVRTWGEEQKVMEERSGMG